MGLETVTQVSDLNELWPLSTDLRTQGDDHLRAIKVALKSLLTNPEQVASRHIDGEIPTLTSSSTATLAHTPSPAASLIFAINGVIQVPGATSAGHYTISGNTLTFNALIGGETLLAWYRY